MPEDQEFEKRQFTQVIRKLLRSKPLPKRKIKTSKANKLGSIIPRQPRQPEPGK